jgi:hypothetical protein
VTADCPTGVSRKKEGIRVRWPVAETEMKWLWTSLAVAVLSAVAMGQGIKPTDWALTQNNIGNTLREQATTVEGVEAARLFGVVAVAYRRALAVDREPASRFQSSMEFWRNQMVRQP